MNLAIDEHASKVYTRATFEQFGQNLYEAGAYKIEEVERDKVYLAKHTKPHKREKWRRVIFKVSMVDKESTLSASVDCLSTWVCFAAIL